MAEKSPQEQLDELRGHHEGVVASLTVLQSRLDLELQAHADTKAAAGANQLVAVEAAVAEVTAKYEAQITELKEKTLLPALKDLQARQAAELAAKHAAELASL